MEGTPITVAGYKLRRQIAVGGQSTIWMALKGEGELAAVKVTAYDTNQANLNSSLKKAKREETIHRALRHDNILQLIAGEWRNTYHEWPAGQYLVLDLGNISLSWSRAG